MLKIRPSNMLQRIVMGVAMSVVSALVYVNSAAQTEYTSAPIDPRLIEIVEEVKSRTQGANDLETVNDDLDDETGVMGYISSVNDLRTSSYSRNPDKIRAAIRALEGSYSSTDYPSLSWLRDLYAGHANLLEMDAIAVDMQLGVEAYAESGGWFERYIALSLSSYLHGFSDQRQAALQKAQSAMALIPLGQDEDPFVIYAKEKITGTIAQLHNVQGNTDLAILTSLEYLRLTKEHPDTRAGVDLINNLIFSHSVARDHDALIYLSQELLEIEKSGTSSILGLSELRVAQVMTSTGDFESALQFSETSIAKSDNPAVIRQAERMKAISLTGLGRVSEARAVAAKAGVNLTPAYLLNEETSRDSLYLGYLLAQAENPALAIKLYNRQIDVTSQKFLANNSRDTTAMLADLENSRERQAERENAAAREARLQEITIDRQRKLNRALMVLSLLLGAAVIAAVLFTRYRGKIMRRLEIKTREAASAERLKTEFLGMISHELRTPLNAIIGISDYLTQYHKDPDIREKTSIILRGGNDLLSVVESLTDMARIDADQMALDPADVDLSEALDAIPLKWAEEAAQKGLTFTHLIDPAITTHNIDGDRLVQCIDVLMSNAVRFTTSGRVHLHVTASSDEGGNVSGLTAVVADTGRGMSDLVQSRLFTPFMQADTSRKRNHMGTGLNLAIAYALVDLMGGKLGVVSREGRGSEFKLVVPLSPIQVPMDTNTSAPNLTSQTANIQHLEAVTVVAQPAVPVTREALTLPVLETRDGPTAPVLDLMQPRGASRALHAVQTPDLPVRTEGPSRILIVDDMEANRDIMRLMLEVEGHICDEAEGGREAIALLETQYYDTVFLDIHMTPMDGIETLNRIRNSQRDYANIPVAALTADNAATTNAACMEAGADLFLTKPVRQAELVKALTYLSRSAGHRILSNDPAKNA